MQIPEELLKRFAEAKKVCVLTGAGISAESGVPTFRGKDGLSMWKGMPFEVISSARMVREDLDEVWAWFDYRRDRLCECRPNPGHIALAEWEKKFDRFTLVTQNVDGLHRAAGSTEIIELHGNINRAYCIKCGERHEIAGVPHTPDKCRECEGRLRPDIVLFGEMLPEGAFERAQVEARECDIFFTIGTSALVYPAAALPSIAKQSGAFVVEINQEKTEISNFCDVILRGRSGTILPLFG
jgi:NAD-dependent deacetylase